MEIKHPKSKEELESYFQVRWEILRKPLGLPINSEKDEFENDSFHVMAVQGNEIIGVGRLTKVSSEEGQIRYMGVKEAFRNSKTGYEILTSLENKARKISLNKIFLNARSPALNFYKKNNYVIEGDSFISIGGIEHFKMIKLL